MTYICASGGTKTMAWRTWTDNSTSTTATITQGSPWGYWVYDATAATTSTAWDTWTNATTSGSYVITTNAEYKAWSNQVAAKKLSKAEKKAERKRLAEQEAAARIRQAEAAKVMKAAEEKRKLASQRAEKLLLSHLNAEQELAWREERAIFVTSQSGKRFKIKDGRAHNIFELGDDGVPIREYCVHVADDVPNADNVLAQKLALEYGEAALLRIANSWPMVNGRR